MILAGVLIIIDAEYRTKTQCTECHQPIGDKDFCIGVQPLLPNSVNVEFVEHVECRVKAEKEFQERKAKGKE